MVEISKANADLIDDGIRRAEDAVADVVLAQVIPDVFHRIRFRAVGR
jgi:flavin-binding protein dodecin